MLVHRYLTICLHNVAYGTVNVQSVLSARRTFQRARANLWLYHGHEVKCKNVSCVFSRYRKKNSEQVLLGGPQEKVLASYPAPMWAGRPYLTPVGMRVSCGGRVAGLGGSLRPPHTRVRVS